MKLLQTLLLFIWITNPMFSQNFWHQTNGPYDGPVNSIAINSKGDIYCLSNSSIFVSKDDGNNWKDILYINSRIYSLYINSHDHILVGTNEGIVKSTDDGEMWSPLHSERLSEKVISINANSKGDVFAGSQQGNIYCLKIGNQQWNLIGGKGITAQIEKIIIGSDQSIYFLAGYEFPGFDMFYSKDTGQNWKKIIEKITDFIALPGGRLCAGTYGAGVVFSIDNGNNWFKSYTKLLDQTYITSIRRSNNGDLFACGGSFTPKKSGYVLSPSNNAIFVSKDGGATWEKLNSFSFRPEWLTLKDTKTFFVGGGKGISRSQDSGENWSKIGLPTASITSVVLNSRDKIIATAMGEGIYSSIDKGKTWEQLNNGLNDKNVLVIAENSLQELFCATTKTVYFYSETLKKWRKVNSVTGNKIITSIAINEDNNTFIGTASRGVFRLTEDLGKFVQTGLTNKTVSSIYTDSLNYIYAATTKGLYFSNDSGKHWKELGLSNVSVWTVTFLGAKEAYVGTNKGVYYSKNITEQNWKKLGNLDKSIWKIVVAPNEDIFVASSEGVFYTSNNGVKWGELINGLTKKYVVTLNLDSNGYLYAGTSGSSLFRSVEPIFILKVVK